MAASGYLALAVYGSLVPLTYQALDWNEALARFAEIRYLNLGIESRSDWVANILLFIPLAWLAMGTLCVDRGAVWAGLCALAVALACHALSWSIEFVQLFFPPRTVSVNDVVAETIGGAIGCVLWLVTGQAITNWCRRILALNRNTSAVPLILPAYLLVLAVIHLMPLDLTISPVEVYHKLKGGKVLVLPFTQVDQGWEFVQDTLWNMAYFAPLGYLLATLCLPDGRPRFTLAQIAVIGLLTTAAIEAMQLFVFTRTSDTTDIVTGAVAALVAATVVRRSRPVTGRAGASGVLGWLLPVVWCGALASLYWWPFNFTTAALPEANGVPLPLWRARRIPWLPFEDYYWQSEYASFDQVLQKGISFAVLGILLAVGWRVRWAWLAVVIALLVAGAIELGQFCLVNHYPSVTDVLIETLGAWCGFSLWQRWRQPQLAAMAVSK
ncbi:MAG: VanZ family protein [Pirellulales bacterium]